FHSKTVKNGVLLSLLQNALSKSCEHCVHESIWRQIFRFLDAGYAYEHVSSAVQGTLDSFITESRIVKEEKQRMVFCSIPYAHRVSHGLKKLAFKKGFKVAFKMPYKLGN